MLREIGAAMDSQMEQFGQFSWPCNEAVNTLTPRRARLGNKLCCCNLPLHSPLPAATAN